MEGHCSTGQSPQWAVVPMEEEEEGGGGGSSFVGKKFDIADCLYADYLIGIWTVEAASMIGA